MTMDHIDPLPTSSTQTRAAGITRRAALGIAATLGLSHGHLAEAAAGKRKRRRKKGRKKKGPEQVRVRFVRTWGSLGAGDGQFDDLKGLAVAPNGDVYVADFRNDRVQVFDASGSFLNQWAIDNRPQDVEVAANSDVFVTARNDDIEQIQRFSAGGTFLDAIGGPGAGDGQFQNLFALAIGATGDVYALDLSPRIQQFSPDGTFIRAWGQEGSGDGDLDSPAALAAAPNGDVYVADFGNFRVQRFSASGAFLGKWGSQGAGQGQFEEPTGITVAPDGTVFVSDAVLNRVQAFTSTGKFLGQFGSAGSAEGQFSEPSGLVVNRNRQIYVADSDNHRIQQFELLKPKKTRKKKKR